MLRRQVEGIPMGTYGAPGGYRFLLVLLWDFMMSLPDDKHAEIIDVFNATS